MSWECSMNGNKRNAYGVWLDNMNGRGHWREIYVDGRIILKRILMKWSGCGLDSYDSEQVRVASICEPRNAL